MKMSWFPQKTYSQSVLKGRRGVDAATLRNRLIKIIEFFRRDSPHTNLYCLETLLAHLNNADNTNNNNNKTTIPLPIGNIPIDSFLSPLEDLIEKTTCQAETIKKMEEELDNVKEKLYRVSFKYYYYFLFSLLLASIRLKYTTDIMI